MVAMVAEYLNYIHDHLDGDNNGIVIVFTASWCNPCKKVKAWLEDNNSLFEAKNIRHLSIDIDTNTDNEGNTAPFFSFLKKKRITRGVPSVLFYSVFEGKIVHRPSIHPDFFAETEKTHLTALTNIIKNI